MVKALILISLAAIITVSGFSQNNLIEYFYIVQNGERLKKPEFAFDADKIAGSWMFSFKPDSTYIEYEHGKKELIITEKIYGPYKFLSQKGGLKISSKVDGNWLANDYYLTKQDTTFLIPNIFSTNIESYSIKCALMDSNFSLQLGKKTVRTLKYAEEWTAEKITYYRIVYISTKNWLPVRIENFNDRNHTDVSSIIVSEP